MSKLKPLHDRVIIERVEEEKTSPGGIVLPDTAKEKPLFGVVKAVGPGKTLDNGDVRALMVKEGNKVLFGKYAGTEVEIEGNTCIVMREDDIMAIVE